MESETEEWKESWRNDWLKSIAAFASQEGGTMIIGKDDKGNILGVPNSEKLLAEIPNTIRNKLGIVPFVKEEHIDGKTCVIITIKKEGRLIDLEGRFYRRSGSTTHMITGEELRPLILSSMGMSWTDLHAENIGMERLSQEAIDFFVKRGVDFGRMSPEAAKCDNEALLRNYELMDEKGLLRSGAILFMDRPWAVSDGACVKIGAFTKEDRLLRHDLVEGPVILQPDRVMHLIMNKYILGTEDIEWLTRVTRYPYPMKAIREAVLNSVAHRDYSSVMETTIRVYPDSVEIWNPGHLPYGWTGDDILTRHMSKPANPKIARVFYDLGYIEKFGRGIEMMSDECKAMGLPVPEYIVDRDIIKVIFRLPEKTAGNILNLMMPDLKGTELAVYELICEGKITTAYGMSEVIGVSERTVRRAAAKLTDKGYVERLGGNKTGKWIPSPNVENIR
ncbi:MAG: putative DNA binding domain-containing protein [Methanomassiliicoccaceae archaeon]|nr:putative DNA binding domain-containing protein [Methanomassiliicoccaceae archaeon]